MDLDDLVQRARSLPKGQTRAVLGITGSPGSGKTTVAEVLVQQLLDKPPAGVSNPWVVHVPMDGYHLADIELTRLGRLDRKGAPDTFDAAGYVSLVERLRRDAEDVIYAPAFDRTIEQPIAGSIPVPRSARLVITEGNYLLLDDGDWRRIRAHLDEVWYCDLDSTERLRRLVERHTRFGKPHDDAVNWVNDVDERNARVIELTLNRADLRLPTSLLTTIGGERLPPVGTAAPQPPTVG